MLPDQARGQATLLAAGKLIVSPTDDRREAVTARIIESLTAHHLDQESRLHPETLLTEIGAVTGFAAQIALRKGVIEPRSLDPSEILVEAGSRRGEKFYFGDALNAILFERMDEPPYSIWSYVAGVVPNPGADTLPDVIEIVRHAARTVGTREFGISRLPLAHRPHRPPRRALNQNWQLMQRLLLSAGQPPGDWPFDLALAAQRLMLMSRDTLALKLSATIVMEAVIRMAKIDPTTVPGV
jgi:hypothetical protein